MPGNGSRREKRGGLGQPFLPPHVENSRRVGEMRKGVDVSEESKALHRPFLALHGPRDKFSPWARASA